MKAHLIDGPSHGATIPIEADIDRLFVPVALAMSAAMYEARFPLREPSPVAKYRKFAKTPAGTLVYIFEGMKE